MGFDDVCSTLKSEMQLGIHKLFAMPRNLTLITSQTSFISGSKRTAFFKKSRLLVQTFNDSLKKWHCETQSCSHALTHMLSHVS